MSLRDRFMDELKAAMRAGDSARVSTLRMVQAKLKDADIAARPGPPLDEAGIVAMLRGMAKSRAESVALYRQGNREELAAKEEAEIAVINSFLPQQLDEAALQAWLRERLPKHMVPEAVHVLAELPMTASGKVAKPELRGLLENSGGRVP